MSAHFKWYPGSSEVIVPWMAQYSFPSQANKAIKMTPRIPPSITICFSNYVRKWCSLYSWSSYASRVPSSRVRQPTQHHPRV